MAKRGGGRPKQYTDTFIAELVAKFNKYIDEAEIPILAEFAYQNNIDRTLLYDKAEFSTLTKKCIAKKESVLEYKALKGEVNPTMAIFSLKQLGWRDKQELEHTGETTVNNKVEVSHLTTEQIRELLKDEH